MDGKRRSSLRSGLPRPVKFAPRIREMIETSPSEEAIFTSDLVARCVREWDGIKAPEILFSSRRRGFFRTGF